MGRIDCTQSSINPLTSHPPKSAISHQSAVKQPPNQIENPFHLLYQHFFNYKCKRHISVRYTEVL